MLLGNASSIQFHLDFYLLHPHWLYNNMKYSQAVAIAKTVLTLWEVFMSDTPTGNGFSSTFFRYLTSLPVTEYPTLSTSCISQVLRYSIPATGKTPTSAASDTINKQIDCKLYPVLVTQKFSNRNLTPWFVPSLNWKNPRHTTLLFFQPGSINWIPNYW